MRTARQSKRSCESLRQKLTAIPNGRAVDLANITHLLVIGWRATEQHFLLKLRERLPNDRPLSLYIVDKDQGADVTLDNLNSALSTVISFGPVEVHKGGFSEFVREGRAREWLSQG